MRNNKLIKLENRLTGNVMVYEYDNYDSSKPDVWIGFDIPWIGGQYINRFPFKIIMEG